MSVPSLRFAVQVAALAFSIEALAQSWRDGTLENLPQPLTGGGWQENRARQQARDRETVESLREFRRFESTWVWTEAPSSQEPGSQGVILFRGTPSGRTPNR
jgi:hypothetical protein